ncbi:MAG: hypothetical protein LBG04_04215 [Holosporaceae bacterium]|jgi:hypothetical protein|nr:hypothetical protein [Holosporaceae bacterium]
MIKNAIIFLPETGIYPYLRSLSILGDALKKSGYAVYIIDCDGVAFRCPMMPNYNMPFIVSDEQKYEKCEECKKHLKNAIDAYGFSCIKLSDYTDLQLLKTIDDLLITHAANLEYVEYRALKIGLIAIHDLMLESKVLSTKNLTKEQLHLYKNYIKNTALMIEIADRIIKAKKPDIILTYNPYAQCQAVRYSCLINDINFKCITNVHHLGVNFSLFQFSSQLFIRETLDHFLNWRSGQEIPISGDAAKNCFDDAIFRMYGFGSTRSHIFSSTKVQDPKSLYAQLNLGKNKKIIGAFTSSHDEHVGKKNILSAWKQSLNEKEVFENQIEWLLFLREFSKTRNDIQIVVRIHPREGRNVSSEHLQILKEFFFENADNFKIIWPDSSISSYDLMEIIDGCLISNSTVGFECQRLGIPTLSYIRNINYPDEGVIETAGNLKEYKKKLENMINYNCTYKEIINCVRFYNWRTFINSLDMGPTIPKDFSDPSIFPPIPEDKQRITVDILEGKVDLIEYNIKNLEQACHPIDDEAESVRFGIRRVIDKLFYREFMTLLASKQSRVGWMDNLKKFLFQSSKAPVCDTFQDYELKYSEDISQLGNFVKKSKKENIVYIIRDGIYSIQIKNGIVIRRCSKMAANLARIHEGK